MKERWRPVPGTAATVLPRAKPFLKWCGGKRQLLLQLLPYVPGDGFHRYFEPFLGGGALFFEMSNLDYFSGHACTPYLNKAGKFNVPFGRYTNPTICDAPTLRAASRALSRAILTCLDFELHVRSARKGDVVYFDPPYAPVAETADFTAFTATGFSPDDHSRLRDVALRLKERGVVVILSQSNAPLIRSLYDLPAFTVHEVSAKRNINSKADRREAVTELIIT
jgi:site-specific DNA-adenine methylase